MLGQFHEAVGIGKISAEEKVMFQKWRGCVTHHVRINSKIKFMLQIYFQFCHCIVVFPGCTYGPRLSE